MKSKVIIVSRDVIAYSGVGVSKEEVMRMRSLTGLFVLTVGISVALGACKRDTEVASEPKPAAANDQPAKATPAASEPAERAKPAESAEPVASAKPAASAQPSSTEAPAMPADWKMVSDAKIGGPGIAPIAKRLGGDLTDLRNTIYQVGDQRVQLNVISAATEEDAAKVMKSLLAIKSAAALLRQGRVIYEFVGPNTAMPAIQAGKAHLERR